METKIVLQGYRVGEIALAARFDAAAQLAPLAQLGVPARVPHAPDWLLGLVNLHGQPVPVFDLAPLLGVRHDAADQPMLLVVGRGDGLAGMVIDGMPRRLHFSPDDRVAEPHVPAILAGYLSSSYRDSSATTWFEFDAARFLDDIAAMLVATEVAAS